MDGAVGVDGRRYRRGVATVLATPLGRLTWVVGLIVAAGLVLWVLRHVLDIVFRPRVRAGHAVPPEFNLPPAVVCLLVHGGNSAPQAAAATLLDLAAVDRLAIAQPGPDPTSSTIAIGNPGKRRTELLPYEAKVFDRVNDLIVANAPQPSSLGDLGRQHRNDRSRWNRWLEDAVITDAVGRGLLVERGNRIVWLFVLGNVLSCTLGLGLATAVLGLFIPADRTGEWYSIGLLFGLSGCFVLPMAMGSFALMGRRVDRYRPTRAGRRATGYWLGVRRWLRGHDGFAELPPAAVQVWGQYLSYGSALGVNGYATAAVGLTGDRPSEVGSVYGGQFRVLQVRYPGRLAGIATRTRIVAVLLGTALLAVAARWWVASGADRWATADRAGWLGPVPVALGGIVALLLGYGLIRGVLDLTVPTGVRGLVVARTELRVGRTLPNTAVYAIVVDTGHGGLTRAWLATRTVGEKIALNTVVDLRARRWSRRIADTQPRRLHPPVTITTTYDLQPSGPTRPKGAS